MASTGRLPRRQRQDFQWQPCRPGGPAGADRHRPGIACIRSPRSWPNLGTPYAGSEYRFKSFRRPMATPMHRWMACGCARLSAQRFGADDVGPAATPRSATRRPSGATTATTRLRSVLVRPRRRGRAQLLPLRHRGTRQRQHGSRRRDTARELSDADKWALIEYLKTF